MNTGLRGQKLLTQKLTDPPCGFTVNPYVSKSRSISTPRLKPLLALHLEPINVVVFHGPHK